MKIGDNYGEIDTETGEHTSVSEMERKMHEKAEEEYVVEAAAFEAETTAQAEIEAEESRIVRIIPSTNLNPKRELSAGEMARYEREYLDYVDWVAKAITEKFPGVGENTYAVILEKMVSPMEYFLRNVIAVEEREMREKEKARKFGGDEK